jgi:hypothetical protein
MAQDEFLKSDLISQTLAMRSGSKNHQKNLKASLSSSSQGQKSHPFDSVALENSEPIRSSSCG